MVKSCCAVGCTNRITTESTVSFHSFPKDTIKKLRWCQALKRINISTNKLWEPSIHSVVCSDHFMESDFIFTKHAKYRRLKDGAVPSKFSWKKAEIPRRSSNSNRLEETVPLVINQSVINDFIEKEHNYSMGHANENLKRKFDDLSKQFSEAHRKMENAKKREKRARHTTEKVLSEMKELKKLTDEALLMLETYKDIPVDLFLKPAVEYTSEQRQFATTLYFYGPKAYIFLREKLNLPHPSTIRRWLGNVESRPGMSSQVLQMLGEKATKDPKNYSQCTLMIDGMSIRKHVDWDAKYTEMVGFVDIGAGSLETTEEATEVIVILAVGLQCHWKVPVAYFLINKLSAEVQLQLVLSSITSLYEHGTTVTALVMDGHTVNQRMVSLLGCSLDPSNIIAHFPHPCDQSKPVCVFFDVCHLMKNLRGALHAYKEFHTSFGPVKWQDIVHLHEFQLKEGLHAANKLTNSHIRFHNQKMNVRLAVQTFSSSVASAFTYLKNLDVDEFKNTTATAKFVSMIDRLFDIFNSKSPVASGYKSPIRSANISRIQYFLMETRDVLLEITDMAKVKIIHSKRKLCVLGFIFNISSLIKLVEHLLLRPNPSIKYLLTYKLSQDHLETYFSAIRQFGGWNNNPSALQFRAAYRSMLSHAGVSITGSTKGNCAMQDTTSLLSVINSDENDVPNPIITFDKALCDHAYSKTDFSKLSPFVEGVIEYIAGWVVRKVTPKLSCADCSLALIKPSSHFTSSLSSSLLLLKNNGGLVFPSNSLTKLLKKYEIILRSFLNIKQVQSGQWEKMNVIRIMQELTECEMFPELRQHFLDTCEGIDTHEYQLLRMICSQYLRLRRFYTVTLSNRNLRGTSIRHSSNKKVLFLHQ